MITENIAITIPDNGTLDTALAALRQRIAQIDADLAERPLHAPGALLTARHSAECALDGIESALRRHSAMLDDRAAAARRAQCAAEQRRTYALLCCACFISGAIGFLTAVYFLA